MTDLKGLETLRKKLNKLASLGNNTTPLMHTVGNILSNSIEDSFENETSPEGKKWKALKPSTIKYKAKHKKSNKILRRDGNLSDNWVVKAGNNSVKVSNNTKFKGFAYGLSHQYGTKNIPARPFLPITKNNQLVKKQEDLVEKAMMDFIKNTIN
ncbi:putative phage virion morphogenesis protein [Campylobacter pinnipediorum subsp. caledonicus]|uniref:Putative phage virion morphogenesis protein n=1 Tax=Campylobacter pinnipediorum subsp. caledonicus TaxID=1874362 RepID=A0A1S6U890_9BACT|nr:phage virion morphogenesis protein [Campylobacter pinnipediorum]AQW87882.1 putative phage virion morphogenesis protein [Campylobacter pinnipediorum subsp. caledonicus]